MRMEGETSRRRSGEGCQEKLCGERDKRCFGEKQQASGLEELRKQGEREQEMGKCWI
jgi:hypothetical protein